MVQSAVGLGVKSAADVFSVTGITLAGPPSAELLVWITSVPCKFSGVVVITRVVKVVVMEGIVVAVTVAVKVEVELAAMALLLVVSRIAGTGLLDVNELPPFSSSKRNTAEKMAHNMTEVSGNWDILDKPPRSPRCVVGKLLK